MNRLASPQQLRNSLIRWALFTVPLVVMLGFLVGKLSGSGADGPWFAALTKPSLFPPPATFGIVWGVLYVLIGFAFALVCSAWGSRWRALAIVAFLLQFALNLAWSPTFFGAHRIDVALAVIVALDVAAVVTTVLFFRVRKLAGWLMLPYLAWIFFATVLNWQFLEANPNFEAIEESGAVQRIRL